MSSPLGTGRARARPRAGVGPPARAGGRSRLSVVSTAGAERRGGVFVAVVVAVLAGGLVGLLVLNTAMQRSAFQLDQLRDRKENLAVRSQVLELEVERLRSPDHLARAATALGMVQMSSPVFLRLDEGTRSGTVLGNPTPATVGGGPQLVPPPDPPRDPGPADETRPATGQGTGQWTGQGTEPARPGPAGDQAPRSVGSQR